MPWREILTKLETADLEQILRESLGLLRERADGGLVAVCAKTPYTETEECVKVD